MKKHFPLAVVGLILLLGGCNPRKAPGFGELAKWQADKETHETKEAINASPKMQELHRLCTEQIPRLKDFVLFTMARSPAGENYLGYGYHSASDFNAVKNFYATHFRNVGWSLAREKIGGWGPSELRYRNQLYEVIITDLSQDGEVTYFIECERLNH